MQTYETIIPVEALLAALDDPDLVVVDCRFRLDDPGAGFNYYAQKHIPGAVYAHLDHDLSSSPVTDHGRHPLPAADVINERFRRLGFNQASQVVVYDDVGGFIAGRLWWMLTYMGHSRAALLDGGWPAWLAAAYPTKTGPETRPHGDFNGQPQRNQLVTLATLEAHTRLIDGRAPERFRGEVEPLDAQAGHIPGAVNRPATDNLDANGRLRPPAVLRRELSAALGDAAPAAAAFYCGSGVSACLNLLALKHAGLGAGRLYVGSWSEWSSDPDRQLAVGPD